LFCIPAALVFQLLLLLGCWWCRCCKRRNSLLSCKKAFPFQVGEVVRCGIKGIRKIGTIASLEKTQAMVQLAGMTEAFELDEIATSEDFDIIVDGAGGVGAATNGRYTKIVPTNGQLHSNPKFKQVGGNSIIYLDETWKINDEDNIRGWYYLAPERETERPALGKWTTDRPDANPVPTIKHVPQAAIGNLHVRIISASRLKDATKPYAFVQLGLQQTKTDYAESCSDPKWDAEPFQFKIDTTKPKLKNLKVGIRSDSSLSADTEPYSVQIDIASLELRPYQVYLFQEAFRETGEGAQIEFEMMFCPGCQEEGILSVRFTKASELPNVDSGICGDVSDPFVRATLGTNDDDRHLEQTKETDHIWNDLNPEWEDPPFEFKISPGPLPCLKVEVLDHNNILNSRPLGSLEVDLEALKLKPWVVQKCEGKLDGANTAKIYYEVVKCPLHVEVVSSSSSSGQTAKVESSASLTTGSLLGSVKDLISAVGHRLHLDSTPEAKEDEGATPKAEYAIGQRVQVRGFGRQWHEGCITSLKPLEVSGCIWDEVRPLEAVSIMVAQTKLKELIANHPDTKRTKFVKNVPIAVYPLNAESLASMPPLILEGMGKIDEATYPNKDAYLNTNFGGAMALQVADGKLDAYPIPPEQYRSNYRVVSLEEMQTKNPKNAAALSGILGDLSTIPGVCGALKLVPTEMVLASDLGFPVKDLLKIEAPWGGDQTKHAGKDAYLVVCDAPYLINLEESGLPVAYIVASDARQAETALQVPNQFTAKVLRTETSSPSPSSARSWFQPMVKQSASTRDTTKPQP
jgi:hypothetical protein